MKLLGQGGEIFRSSVYLPDTVLGILCGLFRVEFQKLLEADGYEYLQFANGKTEAKKLSNLPKATYLVRI